MVYIDSSALLKLLWREPETDAIQQQIATEEVVIVSSLTELEVEVRLVAARMAGRYTETRWRRYRALLAGLRSTDPFRFRSLPGSVFETAIGHIDRGIRAHSRTLDRLHLAAMTELSVRRLMTNDLAQAEAARALGFEAVVPG